VAGRPCDRQAAGRRWVWGAAPLAELTVAAIKLDGAALAADIRTELAARVARLRELGVEPGLGTVLVGDDPASATYVALKHQDCAEIGIRSYGEHLPADASQAEVDEVVDRFNADAGVDAYLLQYPFPPRIDFGAALLRVDPAKDVDGLHPVNLGHLVMGVDGPLPCTPAGIQALLVRYGVPIEGRHVVVVGRGLTIGRPLALLLALKRPNANAAVTVVHTGVGDALGDYTRQGDIVVAAAGSAGLVTASMIRPGAAVVAAGTSFAGKKLLSDVDDSVAEVAGWLSPRIGGVGPMTRAMLLKNAVEAAERRAGLESPSLAALTPAP
jgi:methylenetetrahydrofolate dehydrogenase (NADP+) / methenyltetrahydrofolate cyclohydrolase